MLYPHLTKKLSQTIISITPLAMSLILNANITVKIIENLKTIEFE